MEIVARVKDRWVLLTFRIDGTSIDYTVDEVDRLEALKVEIVIGLDAWVIWMTPNLSTTWFLISMFVNVICLDSVRIARLDLELSNFTSVMVTVDL
jgi:hypothetical protein